MVDGNLIDRRLLQFKDDLSYALQQRGSVLMGTSMSEQVSGQQSHFDKIGPAGSANKVQRGELKTFRDVNFERRLMNFEMPNSDYLIDNQDLLDLVSNYSGDVITNMVYELGRRQDEILFEALSGKASVQTKGSVSQVALPDASKVAVNSHAYSQISGTNDIGLTPSKLKEAVEKLASAHVDTAREDVFVVAPANQLMKLATFDEVVNNDYRMNKPLDQAGLIQGGIQGYLGFNFVQYEYTDKVNTTDETVYVFPRSALKVGIRQPLTVEVMKDATRAGNPDTLSACLDMGAVRMYEEKVIQIACDPSTIIPA